MDPDENVTDLVRRAQGGDAEAADALVTATHHELRRLARARLRAGGRSVMLDTTSLVNEWYLRFAGNDAARIQDRVHFLRHAARVMRSVIVDYARRSRAARRGGGAPHVSLTFQIAERGSTGEEEILRVHESLDELAQLDPRMAQLVEMRFFAGMKETEIGEALGVSERTVRREWEKARRLLAAALESG